MKHVSRLFPICLTLGVIILARSIRDSAPFSERSAHRAPASRRTPGLDHRVLSVSVDGSEGRLQVVEVDPRRWDIRVLEASDLGMEVADAGTFGRRTGAKAVINGGFFDENNQPLGLVVIDGKVRNRKHPANWGIFLMDDDVPKIIHQRDYRPRGETYALESGPRLVVDGRITSLKPRKAFRSAIGITGDGRVVLVATENITLNLADFARILARSKSENGVGCMEALNLDGGPSTQIHIHTPSDRFSLAGGWGVPTAIGVFPKRG